MNEVRPKCACERREKGGLRQGESGRSGREPAEDRERQGAEPTFLARTSEQIGALLEAQARVSSNLWAERRGQRGSSDVRSSCWSPPSAPRHAAPSAYGIRLSVGYKKSHGAGAASVDRSRPSICSLLKCRPLPRRDFGEAALHQARWLVALCKDVEGWDSPEASERLSVAR